MHKTKGTGQLVTLAIEGIEQIKTYLEITITADDSYIYYSGCTCDLYIYTLDNTSSIIVIATVPIIIVFMILLGMAAQKMADNQYDTYRVLSNHFMDTLKGLETLTYLGKSEKHEGKIARVSKQYRKATMKTLRVAFLSSFALDFFTSLSIAFVAVSLGFRLIEGTNASASSFNDSHFGTRILPANTPSWNRLPCDIGRANCFSTS